MTQSLSATRKKSRYKQLIGWVFSKNYRKGVTRVPWAREELVEAASALGVEAPKNLGDVILLSKIPYCFS